MTEGSSRDGQAPQLGHAKQKDYEVLRAFIGTYCNGNHGTGKGLLCPECRELLGYAGETLKKCPLDPKPSCKSCRIHCYGSQQRSRVKMVMSYSGRRLLLRGRFDLLWYYLKHG